MGGVGGDDELLADADGGGGDEDGGDVNDGFDDNDIYYMIMNVFII